MRILLTLSLFLIITACKKENTIRIPVHQGSRTWLQSGFPKSYVNQAKDTLVVSSVSTQEYWLSNLIDVDPNSGFEDLQIIEQRVEIDSATLLSLRLEAGLNDSTRLREDNINISLSWNNLTAVLNGMAWPDINFDPPAYYFEVFTINGRAYADVFLSEIQIDADRLTLYYNIEDGLVGFERNGEIFNLIP